MNKPLTDQALEQLLSDYGKIAPPAAFAYRPKVIPWGKRISALSVAALLSLLILTLTAVMIAGFSKENPLFSPPRGEDGTTILQNTTTAPKNPPVTSDGGVTPPVTSGKPPVTDPPIPPPATSPVDPPITQPSLPSLLPTWYNGTSIRLVNLLTTSTISPPFTPKELKEIYNDYASYDMDMGIGSYQFVSADLVLLSTHPKGHQGSDCNVVYLHPSNGELICLRHELQELWASVGIDASIVWSLSNLHASEDGNRYLFYARADGSDLGSFLYDRTAGTLTKLPLDLYQAPRLDFLSYSADCNYAVMATYRKNDDLLDDLFLIDLRTMEVKQICADYATFGESTFSADGRYVYTHLRIGDSVDSNENGQWVLYDIQTGFTFRGEGEVLYLENGILISRTPEGFTAYDCTTGEPPEDLSSLPLVIDADFNNYRYTITVYNPATGKIEKTIPDVGAYELRGQILYYYVHKAEGVVIANLTTGESVTLPVSATLLTGANPAEGYTIYSLAVSGDGSTVSLGYTISLDDYYKQKQKDIDALLALIQNSALKTNNLPDFWEYFQARRAPYEYLIEFTDYDIHDGYVILHISFIRNVRNDKDTWNLHLVEDYRDGTVTLYNASDNPYHVGNIHARSAYETKVQTFRRTLKKGDYEASCALLPTIGEHRPYYIDYAVCYDEKGKWSDDLAYQARWTYEYLQNEAKHSTASMSKEAREQLFKIIAKYPLNKGISIETHVYRRVMTITLVNQNLSVFYNVEVVVADNGCYYLRNVYYSSCSRQITYEDYLALMETQNRKIVQTGLYKDLQIAFVPLPQASQTSDFLLSCTIPSYYLQANDVNRALAMIREGGYDTDVISSVLFPSKLWIYVDLLTKYTPDASYTITADDSLSVLMQIRNGKISFSDPNPEIPLPASAQ